MSDSKEKQFFPLDASPDGRRNMYSQRCDVLGQVMNYAACLWRQGVLGKPDVRTPADWAPCAEAARCGKCNAVEMRNEEVLKGHSIYFRERGNIQPIEPARTWVMPEMAHKGTERRPVAAHKPAPAPAPVKAKSMLDVMGEGSGYADAINVAAASPIVSPSLDKPVASTVEKQPAPAPKSPSPEALLKSLPMNPGESPLAYARRVAAARKAA